MERRLPDPCLPVLPQNCPLAQGWGLEPLVLALGERVLLPPPLPLRTQEP